jgi:hypothetical protein
MLALLVFKFLGSKQLIAAKAYTLSHQHKGQPPPLHIKTK